MPQPVLSPRDAFFAPRERVPAARAGTRMAGAADPALDSLLVVRA